MQGSLFGKRPLFDDRVLERLRSEWANDPLPAFDQWARSIRDFAGSLATTRGRGKETALEQEFNRAFFVNLLSYQLYPGVNGNWTAWPKPPATVTGLSGEPDLILGHFRNDEPIEVLAVVELKSPGTSLDAPQPSYRNRTPVEQAFDYAVGFPSCRWVIARSVRVDAPGERFG